MRKAGTKTISHEVMEKVWKLHNKHIDARLIAEILGISASSATRIISIMTTAQNGGDVDAVEKCGLYQKQKDFAKKMFGIEEKKEEVAPEKQEKEEQFNAENFKDFMCRVVLSLSYQNMLLERLCAELGVNVKILNEVERR